MENLAQVEERTAYTYKECACQGSNHGQRWRENRLPFDNEFVCFSILSKQISPFELITLCVFQFYANKEAHLNILFHMYSHSM